MSITIDIFAPLTPANYAAIATQTGLSDNAPEWLSEGHKEITQWLNDPDITWGILMEDDAIRETIQDHFTLAEDWIKNTFPTGGNPQKEKAVTDLPKQRPTAPARIPEKPKPAPAQTASPKSTAKPSQSHKKKKSSASQSRKKGQAISAKLAASLPPELRYIRRYKNLHGKLLTKRALSLFLDSLQKAILEKQLRKKSKYADQILHIQEKLVNLYNSTYQPLSQNQGLVIEIAPKRFQQLDEILKSHKVRPAVRLLKRFVGLVKQPFEFAKYERLQTALFNATRKGQIKISGGRPDPLAKEVKEVMLALAESLNSGSLEVSEQTLQGIEGALLQGAGSLEKVQAPTIQRGSIIPSTAFNLTQENRIGLPAYYKSIFGDLAHGFKMLIRGPRGAGKSTLAIQFANWMAKAGHRVLYIADEEGFSDTMHDRLERMGLKHSNLHLTDLVPDLSQLWPYDCIFIDSITSANLDLTGLEAIADSFENSGKSMVLVGQVTTSGELRGGTRVPHKVDVEVETFKKGEPGQEIRYARTEKSRYGSGGMQEINTNDNYYETYFSHSA